MKKSDLRTGMWVKFRNGKMCIVLRDTNNGDLCVDGDGFMDFPAYTEDLKVINSNDPTEDFDIVEIWQPKYCGKYYEFEKEYCKLLWKRPEPRTLTFAEAEKILADHLGQNVVIKAG